MRSKLVAAGARALLRTERGAALVEFAVVAPVLAFLLIGLIDFGRYTYDGILAANAARAAAAYGSQTLITAANGPGMTAAGQADAAGLSNLTVNGIPICMSGTTQVTCGTSGATAYVQVTTTGTFTPLIKYPGLPSSINVSGSSTMRVEAQ